MGRPVPGRVMIIGALLTAFLTAGYVIDRAVSEDPGTCERYANQSAVREQVVHGVDAGRSIAVIGDSYSAGLLLDDLAASWPSRLSGEVHVYGFSGSGFAKQSSPCRNVSYADRARRALQGNPQLLVVQGGLNDVGEPTADVRAGVRRLLRAVGDVPVAIVGPPSAPARRDGAEQVDRVLAQEARRAGVPYVSTFDLALAYLDGGLHLTPEGHREFGDAVAGALPG